MYRILSLTASAFCILSLSVPAHAGPKSDLKQAAIKDASLLRNAGEPLDRCALNVDFSKRGIVIVKLGDSSLQEGDTIFQVNGITIEANSLDALEVELRKIQPTEEVTLIVGRNGSSISVKDTCVNAKPDNELRLKALDYAAKRKFDDCFETLNKSNQLRIKDKLYRMQCASVAKRKEDISYPNIAFETYKDVALATKWDNAAQAEFAQFVIQREYAFKQELGNERYEHLASIIKSGPDGNQLWENAKPNFDAFRENASVVVRSLLIDPASARIDWPYDFIYGDWKPFLSSAITGYFTCGVVNAKNRMGGYTGSSYFVVVLGPDGKILHSQLATQEDIDFVRVGCEKTVKNLPALEQEAINSEAAQTGKKSVSDELFALNELYKNGALTAEEFSSAKEKILLGN